jgi:prepilin-type N-terminal cleavage/methylation domain-containing protein/prepilin-type processing-associated H-X9-DG protein
MDVPMKKQKAFTLLELLVVIGMIAILLAVMVPSLARAKELGRKTSCLSNLHQFYLAAMVYTQDYKGSFPMAYYTVKSTGQRTDYCWDFTVVRSAGVVSVSSGTLWQGETIEKIQQCPSFSGQSNTASDPYTGYNYNTSYIGHGQNEMQPEPDKWNQISRPAYCALFGDGQYSQGANKFMRSSGPSDSDTNFVGRWAGTQGYRHDRKTNVIWCDGKVESRPDCYTSTTDPETKQALEDYNRTNPEIPVGFLSADNSAYRPN